LSSRPGEFHPQPLTEPCLTVSHHTALRSPRGFAAIPCALTVDPPTCVVVGLSNATSWTPSLQSHYSLFITTTSPSAITRCISTFSLAGCLLVLFDSQHRVTSPVPWIRLIKGLATYMPDTGRATMSSWQSLPCRPGPNDPGVFVSVQSLDTSSVVHLRSTPLTSPEAVLPPLFLLPFNTSSLRNQHRKAVCRIFPG